MRYPIATTASLVVSNSNDSKPCGLSQQREEASWSPIATTGNFVPKHWKTDHFRLRISKITILNGTKQITSTFNLQLSFSHQLFVLVLQVTGEEVPVMKKAMDTPLVS